MKIKGEILEPMGGKTLRFTAGLTPQPLAYSATCCKKVATTSALNARTLLEHRFEV